jgi:Ni/Co efflux regulator RcnB
MRRTLATALAVATFAGGVAAASAADARPRHGHPHYDSRYYDGRHYDRRHYRDRDDDDGAAIAAGIVGLALGAALASGANGGVRYDNRGYYDQGYYAPPQRYYAPRSRYDRTCRTTRYFDRYYGRYVERTRCW